MNNQNKPEEDKIYNVILSILGVLIFLGLCYLGYMFYTDYQETIASYKEQIDNLHLTISSRTQELNKYKEKTDTYSKQVSFMDKYVAICPMDGSGLYHKYSCEHYNKSDSFMIFNIGNTENMGYLPCYYCQSDNQIEETNNVIVYVTDTGSKYHRSGCSYLRSKNAITKEKAINQGYSACSRCKP